jgi:PTS system mannose-specific IIA component
MIGIVIVTHSQLGDALIDASQLIIGERLEAVAAVSIDIQESAKTLRKKIADGVKSVDQRHGVIILTDMFGGTPSNLSYTFLEEGRIEVLSGVNLPIVIKALNSRTKMTLVELAATVEEYGKNSISLASGILKGNKRRS